MACDPFRQDHKRIVAETLLGIYGDVDDKVLFLSIGKTTPWAGSGTAEDPPKSIDSVLDDTQLWRNLFAHKRIDRSDVSLVVRRYDWKPGVVYTAYRDDLDLFDDLEPAPFYVLVDEERVYKCIDNAGGAASLVAPTYTDAQIRRLSDGYRWKFLYQIPESKRRFLTETQAESIGYMPVEFVDYLKPNDERILQWRVQESAVDGEIAFVRLDQTVRPFVVSDACLFPSGNNTVVSDVMVGDVGLTVTSPNIILKPDYYVDMVLSIDQGQGQGQRRRISDFTPSAGGAAFVRVSDPFTVSLSGGGDPSIYSIVPNIRVVGDGFANNNTYNPYAKGAEVSVRFGGTADSTVVGVTSCADFFEVRRTVDSIEVVDGGKDYTFATLEFVKGLVVPTDKVVLEDLGTPIMSPKGGHGSNPVRELGCSSIMLSKQFSQDEEGKVSVGNDFRQFSLILNPLLTEKQVRIKFFDVGLTNSFAVGGTATQDSGPGFSAAYGEIVSWRAGASGHSGTSELVLTKVRGGDFKFNGTVNSFKNLYVEEKTVAGTESRRLLRLTLFPTDPIFLGSGTDFTRGYIAHGIGDTSTTLYPSRATGEVYAWEPQVGSNILGYLYLENPQGSFKVGERVSQADPFHWFHSRGLSGIGIIKEIGSVIREGIDTYDQTTSLVMAYDGDQFFENLSFPEDKYLVFAYGATSSANGYVMDWSVGGTGTTGTLRISGSQGEFLVGMTAGYGNSTATVSDILHRAELRYRSGEVLYIQNMKPIRRDLEQSEEIKIVIDL